MREQEMETGDWMRMDKVKWRGQMQLQTAWL